LDFLSNQILIQGVETIMRNFVINDDRLISPFNEPARDLMVIGPDNEPATLRIHQKELTSQCIGPFPLEQDLSDIFELEAVLSSDTRSDVRPDDEVFVYRDNIYFDEPFLQYFLKAARQLRQPCQAVLIADDPAWRKYSFPLSSLQRVTPYDGNDYYPIEMWYFPRGWVEPNQWHAIAVPSDALEKGYYNIPDSMSNIKVNTVSKRAGRRGQSDEGMHREQDLTHWLSERTCVVIESWVHLFNASIPLGVFSYGSRFEEQVKSHNIFAIRLFLRAILEQKQILSSSKMVKVGPGCDIHPEAIILGPTTIGRNCSIGPGVVIDNCIIGDNVNIAQGSQLMLSVVGHNSFLPFRAALFMTMIMENTIIAQNTCLQMCVIGRNSFIGAGTTFTDFNLLPSPIKAIDHAGNIGDTGQPVLGGCVGHNCRIGAGLLIYPARMIESDVILTARPERRVIMKNITYEQSDHHQMAPRTAALHQRFYVRGAVDENQLLEEWT
jgi:carbonic anhydrase/acetyltransferase-like protein (isoleucine patch superfamily)